MGPFLTAYTLHNLFLKDFPKPKIHFLQRIFVFSSDLMWWNCSIVKSQFEEFSSDADMFEICRLLPGLGLNRPGHKVEGGLGYVVA